MTVNNKVVSIFSIFVDAKIRQTERTDKFISLYAEVPPIFALWTQI